ncbi:Haloalkane dehalogenase [Paraburkholderia sacchari]|uniref:alpha/beta fold hydrolase n=1 Tax=Paraburkholderia sacchari TaxID=159450 RepID=UPI0039A62B7D
MATDIVHRLVEANGVTFHVAVSGPDNAAPVLCIHGFPEGWMSWRHLMHLLPRSRIYAPDLRGYPGSSYPKSGYDVFTLTDDIKALIEVLGIRQCVLVSHDWGGALGWIFAHRYSSLISKLVVVNCTHPRTLVRAVVTCEDWQPFRIPWVPFFQIPWFPEWFMTTAIGRKLLKWTFLIRQGQPGTMDVELVDELVARFAKTADMHGPIEYYRQIVLTILLPERHRKLYGLYATPISVPVTVIWGMKDGALPALVARKSFGDAGCNGDWRPLEGVGHFVDLEAWEKLADELERVLDFGQGDS